MSAPARLPRATRVAPGAYYIEEGECRGWWIEDVRQIHDMPQNAAEYLWARWLVIDGRRRVVSGHRTYSDARGSMPRITPKSRLGGLR